MRSHLLPITVPVRFSWQPLGEAETSEAFLWQLFRECRDAEMGKGGIPPFPEPIIRFQFAARERSLRKNYPGLERTLVRYAAAPDKDDAATEGIPIGAVVVCRPACGALRLVDIALLPFFQNRGIGTVLMGGLQAEAQTRNVPVTLSVAADNVGARRLYTRLGFQPAAVPPLETPVSSVHVELIWRAVCAARQTTAG